MSLHAADGSYNVVFVDGTTLTGLYDPSGAYNVVEVDGTDYTGLFHPCGAYNVFFSLEDAEGTFAPCGALNVTEDPYIPNSVHITDVTPTPPEE